MLQPPLNTQEIDAKCFQEYRLAKKVDKNTGKKKSIAFPSTDIPNKYNPATKARLIKKIKTTKEVFGVVEDKDRITATTLL